ncbi:serine hydrolase [Actinomycetospora sp. CA-101289]|uniref:serine hydrolase n=1 Tax=Actinomycetospora sp. CA-101289 TaxID=3239893 RepID=UPI003D997144
MQGTDTGSRPIRLVALEVRPARSWGGPVTVAPSPTDPLIELLGPERPLPEPPPPRRPRRRARRRRVLVLALVLGAVVATATADLAAPPTPPTPPVGAPRVSAPALLVPPPADPSLVTGRATAEIDGLVGGDSPARVSVATVDVATGRSFGYAPDTALRTASVVKLDILQTLLLQNQEEGSLPSGEAQELATRMMQQSDNDAASTLWEDVGGIPAIAAANRRLGLDGTELDDHWGVSTTSATDQLALLAALDAPTPLDPDARAFARDLMTHVADDQRWGVSAAADPGTTPALKNGWMPVGDEGWVVGSVGRITVGGRPVLLAVLTEGRPSKEAGVRLVESLSRIATGAVTAR